MASRLIKLSTVMALLGTGVTAFAATDCCGDLMACCMQMLACCFD